SAAQISGLPGPMPCAGFPSCGAPPMIPMESRQRIKPNAAPAGIRSNLFFLFRALRGFEPEVAGALAGKACWLAGTSSVEAAGCCEEFPAALKTDPASSLRKARAAERGK